MPPRLPFDGPSAPASAPSYGRWGETPADAPSETPVEVSIEPVGAIPVEEPEAAPVEPPVAAPVEPPPPAWLVTPPVAPEAPVTALRLVPSTEVPAQTPAVAAQPETQAEFLRLLEVVTSMCDHVIEYIEADRAERRMMIETLAQLSRTITDGARAVIAAAAPAPLTPPTDLFEPRERVVGGSMPAGPERDIDLRGSETQPEPRDRPLLTDASLPDATATEIAVEVRGRFGDRWVDGFEICEVMTTPDGPRYRLRRHRDGVVLPELFDATSIRHIETFEQLNGDPPNGLPGYWSRS